MRLPKFLFIVFTLIVLLLPQLSACGKILVKQSGTIVVSNATVEIVQAQPSKPQITFSKTEMFIVGIVILSIFLIVLGAGAHVDKTLQTGEFRRALAAALVFGFTAILLISVLTGFEEETVVSSYISAATLVVGFYFGSKATQTQAKDEPKNTIEDVEFESEERRIFVYYRNRKSRKVTVDGLYLNGKKLEGEFKVDPKSLKKIDFGLWENCKEYHIKVCTSDGECCEKTVKAPCS